MRVCVRVRACVRAGVRVCVRVCVWVCVCVCASVSVRAFVIVYLNVGGETVCIRKQALQLAAPGSQLVARVAFGGTDSSRSHHEDGLFIDEPIECFKSIIAYLRLKALLLELERAETAARSGGGGGGGGVAVTNGVGGVGGGNKIYVTEAQLPDLTRMLDYYGIEAPYQVTYTTTTRPPGLETARW